jgi:hypothetical protein
MNQSCFNAKSFHFIPSSALINSFTPSRPRKRSQIGPSSCSAINSNLIWFTGCLDKWISVAYITPRVETTLNANCKL